MHRAVLLSLGILLATAGPIGFAVAQRADAPHSDRTPEIVRGQPFDLSSSVGRLDEEVWAAMNAADPSDDLPVLVFLRDRVDLKALKQQFNGEGAPLAERHERVVRALQEKARDTQGPVLSYLHGLESDGVVGSIKPFWIDNSIAIHATPAAILAIEQRDDVLRIFYDYKIKPIEPVSGGGTDNGFGMRSEPERGLVAIGAPDCWTLGYDGTGMLTSTLDTGVDGNHSALKDRWRGTDDRYSGHPEWAWNSPVGGTNFPNDSYGHGTHTMGTVCGGDPGDQIGVAPGAQWIASDVINQGVGDKFVNDVKAAYQWLIDPDGDPSSFWDVPTANSNSWGLNSGFGYPACSETFWEGIDACELAGIVVLYSAGNEGSGSETLRNPADRATTDYNCCAVGAVDSQNSDFPYPIAGFSSRGPSHCTDDGSETIKPEVSAPGVDVRSSLPGGGYGQLSGTSMASPHVNGAVCLMRQANPEILVDDIKQILYDTARDEGDTGDDNDYGHGVIDAYAAVQAAAATAGIHFDFPDGRPKTIDPDGGTKFKFNVSAGPQDTPVVGSGKFFVDTGNGFEESQVDILGDNQYQAVFPTSPCDIKVKYYVSADGESGKTYYNPALAPGAYYTATVYNEIGVAYADDFESAKSGFVAAKGVGVTSGKFERVKPVGDPNWPYAPAADSDGSGVCWVTDNRSGESDVDSGCVWITSGALDLSQAVSLRFAYWVYNENDVSDVNGLFVQLSKSNATGFRDLGHITASEQSWHTAEFSRDEMEASLGAKLTDKIYVRFKACDKYNHDHRVEVAIDALKIEAPVCNPHGHKGDMDCDGFVNFNDVDPFVLGLADPGNYAVQYPNCRLLNGDINGDDFFDFNDIDGFVECLVNGGCP